MDIAKENRKKYIKPPTFLQVEEFRKMLGVRGATMEHFYDLGRGTYYKYKIGEKNLPARLWHIFYEKILPQTVADKPGGSKKRAKTTHTKIGQAKKKEGIQCHY